jgi:predicted ribosomally synthesized peptide with SipW-like signal peptide
MKKIALASAAMGGVALFAFGASGTFASFTDSEGFTATAQAGTMDLQVGGPAATSVASLEALNPGQSTAVSYWVNNAGTVAGDLTAKLSVVDAENGCTDAESKLTGTGADNCSQWTTGGELSKYAKVQFLDATATNETDCKSATSGTSFSTSSAVAAVGGTSLGALAANTGNCVVLKVTLPATAGNIVQGDTAQWTAALTLAQPELQGEVTAPIATAPAGLPG